MLRPLDIRVSGHPLALECFLGDVQMSTVWPGGSDELSWTSVDFPASLARGGVSVDAYYGGVCVWKGYLLEPDPSQGRMTAQGLWHLAEKFPALDGSGVATNIPDTAIDNAVSTLGLPWSRPVSIRSTAVSAVDISQGPVTLSELMDGFASPTGISTTTRRWGVDELGNVFVADDPTTPSLLMTSLVGGLGYALDDYASTIVARYFDSGTSTYKTVTVTNASAASAHGPMPTLVDLVTGRPPLSSTQATNIATNLLNVTKAIPQWTAPLEVSYGELLTAGGVPVALETVQAGQMVRVYTGTDFARSAGYTDLVIGQTSLSGGTLTLTPVQIAPRNLTDVLTAALQKTK